MLKAYAWARAQCDLGSTVIGGFHTPVERDVYAILARRGACIIHCLASHLPKRLSPDQKALIAAGRLLLLSPYTTPTRKSRETCQQSNQLALTHASSTVVAHLHPQSTLRSNLIDSNYHQL